MAYEFKLPSLGENIEEADVASILVSEGDQVQADDPVVELETDKASLEVPIDKAGTIKEIRLSEGDKAKVGAVIIVLETDGTEAGDDAGDDAGDEDTGEEVTESVQEADSEEQAEPESEPKPEAESGTAAATPAPQVAPTQQPSQPSLDARGLAPASPTVRRFAREIGIDVNQVPGTGPGSRISVEDVKAFAKSLNTGRPMTAATGAMPAPALPDFAKWGDVSAEPMSKIRQKTSEHMSLCWQTIPHVTQFDKADITQLEKARKQYAKKAEAAGGKLTITSILLKIVASALKKFPQFNSSLDTANQQVIYKEYCHVGIAVDTDRGLLVPVIRDVDQKNIVELSAELSGIAEKARDKKISLEDMQGGTFTITNLGGIGGTAFTPIVNWPEVAILGVARGSQEPVWEDGQFVPRLMMPLCLSYDHRVIDGADGARFLRWICEALENPFLLPLEG